MKKGILIFAVGHQNYYFMAENLAASLLTNGVKEAGISICIVTESKKRFRYPELFDDFVIVEPEKFMVDGKVVFNNLTVKVYDFSPYDITMKLDADIIWLGGRPVAHLFHQLKDVNFTFSNRGPGWEMQNSPWASEHEIKRKYNFTDEHKLYRVFGEFVYFKKCAAVKKLFTAVKKIYAAPKVKCQEFANGNMTDELAFQIACMETGLYPHADNYNPVFNGILKIKEHDFLHPYQLPENYFAYSIGGNRTNQWFKDGYNNLAKHYFHKNGLTGPYLASNKKSFLQERQII